MIVVHHPDQALHDPATVFRFGRFIDQPDRAERYHRFLAVASPGNEVVVAPDTGMDAILAVHDPDYIAFLQTAWRRWQDVPGAGPDAIPNVHPTHRMHRKPRDVVGQLGWYSNSTSCPIAERTWDAVFASARSAVHAADLVAGGARAAYALCRPPGHHAYPDLMTGVCYLNNSSIAAHRLAARFGRAAVLDIDVHHGNGTQHIFYRRGDVMTVSIHADPTQTAPFYAGDADETGEDAGRGLNLNIPLPFGTANAEWLLQIDRGLAAIRAFAPTVLVVALGFDASEHDPVQAFKITVEGFGHAARRSAAMGLPTLLVQEGGYLSPRLGDHLGAFLTGFA